MKKLMSLAAFGAGYVLGARAGRERYDQLMRGVRRVRDDPRVQEQTQKVTEVAKEQAANVSEMAKEQAHNVTEAAKQQAPAAMDKVSDVAASAVRKVHSSTEDSDADESSASSGERTPFAEETPQPEAMIPTSNP